jgi:beta-glucosidase
MLICLKWLLCSVLGVFVLFQFSFTQEPVYKDSQAPVEKRIDFLLGRMTLEEKISQLMNDAPAIERLDVPAYNWWNECLHGVARAAGVITGKLQIR